MQDPPDACAIQGTKRKHPLHYLCGAIEPSIQSQSSLKPIMRHPYSSEVLKYIYSTLSQH